MIASVRLRAAAFDYLQQVVKGDERVDNQRIIAARAILEHTKEPPLLIPLCEKAAKAVAAYVESRGHVADEGFCFQLEKIIIGAMIDEK